MMDQAVSSITLSPSPNAALPERQFLRSLRCFLAYRFFSTAYFFIPILVPFLKGRGLSFTQILLLNSIYCVTLALLELPTGLFADWAGRKVSLVAAGISMAAGCFLYGAAHAFLSFSLAEVLLAIGMTLASGADSAYLYDLLANQGLAHEYR